MSVVLTSLPLSHIARRVCGRGASKTRQPEKTRAPEMRRANSDFRFTSSGSSGCAVVGSRQICPPGARLSSSNRTCFPCIAAVVAAVMPAGPAPMTSTSASVLIGYPYSLRFYGHAGMAEQLTGAPVEDAVDGGSAVEANAHPAECSARLAGGRSAARNACGEQSRANNGAGLHLD